MTIISHYVLLEVKYSIVLLTKMTGLITELSHFNSLHTTTLSCVLIASKLSSQKIYFVWKAFARALPK